MQRAGTMSALCAGMLCLVLLAACAPSTPAQEQPKAAGSTAQTASGASGSAASAPSAPKAQANGTVVIAQGTDVNTFDPQQTQTQSDWNAIALVYEPLVRRNNDMKIGPALATSWRTVDDRTWEFKLRGNVKFTNGEPFDASVVKANYDRYVDPKTNARVGPWLAQIERVDVVDPMTVRFVTKAPFPVMLENLTSFYLMSPRYFTGKTAQEVALGGPGTGPYILKEWVKDDHLTLERNPDYADRPFPIQKVIFRAIPDSSTRVGALIAGEVNMIVNVPPSDAARISGNAQVVTVPSTRGIYVNMETAKPPFDNKLVRQALNYAVDKDSLVKNVLDGKGVVLNGQVLTPEYFGYNPNLKPYPYDPEKAKQLLAQAGFNNTQPITLRTPQGRYLLDKELADAIAGQLSKIGLKVNVDVLEFGNYMDRLLKDRTIGPMWLLGYSVPTLDADAQLSWYDSAIPHSYWKNEQFESLLKQARETIDQAARKDLYWRATELMREEAPTIFLHQQHDLYGITKNFEWTPRPDQVIWLEGASVH